MPSFSSFPWIFQSAKNLPVRSGHVRSLRCVGASLPRWNWTTLKSKRKAHSKTTLNKPCLGLSDVLPFGSAGQQHHMPWRGEAKVDAISWPGKDTEFKDSVSDTLVVSEIAVTHSGQPYGGLPQSHDDL